MARGASEFDKFVNTFLATQKSARDTASAEAREKYYDALASKASRHFEPDDNYNALVNAAVNKLNGGSTASDDHSMADLPTEPLARSREVIAKMETGGEKVPYQTVVGLTHKNGQKDEALGRYGVLLSNLPTWSEKYLGKKITRDEFLNNTDLQDKIFDGEFGGYLKSGKKPEEAAAMWLGGPKGLANKASDKFGSTTASYSSDFAKAFYPGRRGRTELTQTASAPSEPIKAPSVALPILANAPVLPTSTQKPASSSKDSLPPGFDAGDDTQEAAIPGSKPARSMDYVPLEIREKATAGSAGKPQAALEDEYLPDDTYEFASDGGKIGSSVDYPLHHVVGEAMRHTQNMYGLNAYNGGAIQDPAYTASVKSFLGNSRAPSPEAMNALLSRYKSEREPVGTAMRQVYAHFANGGDVTSAKEAVAGLLQGARRQAMEYGSNALSAHEQGDYPNAARHLMAAYNMVPDNHSFTGEVNHNGFGSGQFINHDTNQPIQKIKLTPDIISSAAQNLASGAGFYPHLAHATQREAPVKKYFGAGAVNNDGLDTGYELNDAAAAEDEQTARDAALSSPQTQAEPAPTQISEKAIDDELLSRGWKSGLKAPEPPPYVPLHPDMDSGQRAFVTNLNQRLFNQYKVEEQEYRQQVGQELSKERIGIRQDFTKQQSDERQKAALEREQRQNDVKEEQRKLRTQPDYAFQKDINPLVEKYNSADQQERYGTGLEIMNARAAMTQRSMKQTAKERDPEHLTAQIDDAWKSLNGIAKEDPNVKRSDGSNMTNVKDRAFVELDKLPGVKRQFYDVMYGLVPLNEGKHTPDAIMQTVHDLAFKKSAKPEFDPNTGMIKYGGVKLVMSGDTWQRILDMRAEAKAGQKQIENTQTAARQKDVEAPQRRSEAISMRPADLSADQQYAIKYGLNPNTSPDEVDRRRQWGALQ
jgi:hypothetical protein